MSDVTLDIAFPVERHVDDWQYRHAQGKVPGFWPYGLDGLGRYVDRLRAQAVAEPDTLARARARLTRRGRHPEPALRWNAGETRPTRDIALSWDENAARRMLAACPRPEMYCGVIWATDAAARGADISAIRRVLRLMSGMWVISSGQQAALVELVGENGPPVGFFRFGVDETFFTFHRPPTTPLVLSIGGDRDRDTETLFAALGRVHELAPETEIVVQTSSTLPPPAGVRTIERVSHVELAALYARASVVAIATRQNLHASGMTVSLEAMASGRPVVISDTPGIRDYVQGSPIGRSPQTGLLVPVGDAGAMAAQIVALLNDPELCAALGRGGRQVVETELNTTHMVRELAAFIGL
ncbi:glycosyltransferase family 4 protein [Subtercola lobariae]|uniref:Glycosyl transferase family 1 n=1 Tax=Subtercola lobariae TaxID=1588641 RepID=A0A917EW54_9MICO|nr:glycosyltransferase family 4 protein [Subtercola lobariae]GGF13868.1 glycosyl transferase family 1 [Subtercola lobariae]